MRILSGSTSSLWRLLSLAASLGSRGGNSLAQRAATASSLSCRFARIDAQYEMQVVAHDRISVDRNGEGFRRELDTGFNLRPSVFEGLPVIAVGMKPTLRGLRDIANSSRQYDVTITHNSPNPSAIPSSPTCSKRSVFVAPWVSICSPLVNTTRSPDLSKFASTSLRMLPRAAWRGVWPRLS